MFRGDPATRMYPGRENTPASVSGHIQNPRADALAQAGEAHIGGPQRLISPVPRACHLTIRLMPVPRSRMGSVSCLAHSIQVMQRPWPTRESSPRQGCCAFHGTSGSSGDAEWPGCSTRSGKPSAGHPGGRRHPEPGVADHRTLGMASFSLHQDGQHCHQQHRPDWGPHSEPHPPSRQERGQRAAEMP